MRLPYVHLSLAPLIFALAACVAASPMTRDRTQDAIGKAVNGPCRTTVNMKRDMYRHPEQTLAWFGLSPDQSVIEMTPGYGWYTEILAPLVRDRGHYVAAVFAPNSTDVAPNELLVALRTKLKADPACYDRSRILLFDLSAPLLGPPESADVVLTFRNVHNWEDDGVSERMFRAMGRVLKVGGHLGVTDHRADPERSAPRGYISQNRVIALAREAGLEFVASSEINANPRDTKDYTKGVWTLPPTLMLGAVDAEKFRAIGESDRMTLLFRKTTITPDVAGAGRTP